MILMAAHHSIILTHNQTLKQKLAAVNLHRSNKPTERQLDKKYQKKDTILC
jgi:hypothetical protein